MLAPSTILAQSEDDLVQFSGVVVTADSLQALPFVNIIIKNTGRGTISDYFGFFSFVAKKNDLVVFSYVGYKRVTFIVPDTLPNSTYSMIQMMTPDTIFLSETVIYSWPTIEQFKNAFITYDVPDDDLERAKKNIAWAELKEMAKTYPMDGSMNYKNNLDQRLSKLYYIGQYPPISVFNPFAWAEFIKAWRRGDFKRKD